MFEEFGITFNIVDIEGSIYMTGILTSEGVEEVPPV
jgi:hypothetical protein